MIIYKHELLLIQYEPQIPFCKHDFGLQMTAIVSSVHQLCVDFQDK